MDEQKSCFVLQNFLSSRAAAQEVQKAQKADFRPMRAGCGADGRKDGWNNKHKSPGVLQDCPLPDPAQKEKVKEKIPICFHI